MNYYFKMKFVHEIRSCKAQDKKDHLPWGKGLEARIWCPSKPLVSALGQRLL